MTLPAPRPPRTPDACSIAPTAPAACWSTTVDPSLSVNETLRRWPAALAALNAHGIDTCCGGAASLADAAREAGVSCEELLDAIGRATAEGA